jgi:hypothetical protein
MFSVGSGDFSKGNIDYAFGPLFSHAYGDLRHLPTILVENHSLKPYRQRVLGTYILLEETLKLLPKEQNRLKAAIDQDREKRSEKIPISWEVPQFSKRNSDNNEGSQRKVPPPDSMILLGVQSQLINSEISNGQYLKFSGKPIKKTIPFYKSDKATHWLNRAKSYYVPPSWSEVIHKLKLHGVEMTFLDLPELVDVTMYRMQDAELQRRPFEGRVKVSGTPVEEQHSEIFPKGTAVIHTDQPLGDLVTLLLEPEANDSFYSWGFFLSILNRTEYMESYAVEPLMQKMLNDSDELKSDYLEKMKTDSSFSANPRAIRNWFYRQSPYHDERYLLYPVGILK